MASISKDILVTETRAMQAVVDYIQQQGVKGVVECVEAKLALLLLLS